MADSLEWYWTDSSGGQQGPGTRSDIKTAFDAKKVNDSCLAWNENLDNWTPIKNLADLMKFLVPPVQAPAVPTLPSKPAITIPGLGTAPALKPAAQRQQPVASPQRAEPADMGSLAAQIAARRASLSAHSANSPIKAATPTPQEKKQQPTPQQVQQEKQKQLQQQQEEQKQFLQQQQQQKQQLQQQQAQKDEESKFWKELFTPEGVPYYYNSKANTTQWEKPDCLKSPEEQDKAGNWFWLPHAVEGFIPARKIQQFYDGRVEVEDETGKKQVVGKNVVLEPLSWSSLRRPVRDLVLLDAMNQPLILHNLKQRFQENEIYTNIGTILISCNPYKLLPLYTPTIINQYRNRGNKELPPHIFTIADDAYNMLVEKGVGQSIVISGESGAGKTECTKQCLQYLAEVAGSSTNVESKILQANPILEAFGNAKTVRNNNSSRFGKYVEIFFDSRYSICGARTTNYLLEKIRVCQQTGDERNYHIFYQLCCGASPQMKKEFSLRDASTFKYLNQSGNVLIDGVDDSVEFQDVLAAMEGLQFTPEEQHAIFQITCAVLHLGDICFQKTGDRSCCVDDKDPLSVEALKTASRLFEVDPAALQKAITFRQMITPGQAPIDIGLSKNEAIAARDAFAKFVYAKLFDWLVVRINNSIGTGMSASSSLNNKAAKTIGILDIFGFEIFEVNSIEQLFINFTNEKLQQNFNNNTFKLEEAVYQQEQIQFDHVSYIDNQPVLDLIEAKGSGIIALIDEELRMPKGNDKTFVEKLHMRHAQNKQYQKVIQNPENFLVRHYAGDVVYQSDGFLVKSKDRMLDDLYSLLQTTKNKFLRDLFSDEEKGSNMKKSLGAKFQQQLDELMTTLNATEPHYVRCVKPNKFKQPLCFDPVLVLQQLQYSGVFEAVQIRKSGFPFRYSHLDFFKRFKCLKPKTKYNLSGPGAAKAACLDLLAAMGMEKRAQVGVSKILYRAEEHKDMELKRNLAVEKTVVFLQQHIRGYQARKLAKQLRRLKPILIKAMKDRTIPAVEAALQQASGLTFPLYEWQLAKQLKERLYAEERVKKTLEELANKDPEVHYDLFKATVEEADQLEVKTPHYKQAKEKLEEVAIRRQTRAWLKEGVEEADEEKLKWALGKVDELKLQNIIEKKEIDNAKAMRERIEKEKVIISKLERAFKEGQFLKEGDVPDCSSLEAAFREATSFQCKTPSGVELTKRAELWIAMRSTLKQALGGKDKQKWKAVETAFLAAAESYSSDPEVNAVGEEVSHQAAVGEVTEQLSLASKQLLLEQLQVGLQKATFLKIDDVKYPIVRVARFYFDKLTIIKQKLAEALRCVDEKLLVPIVLECDKLGFDVEEVARARQLRNDLLQLQVEMAQALKVVELAPLQECARKADILKVSSPSCTSSLIPDVERVRQLINMSEDKFVQEQLKACNRNGDKNRATRITIKLRNLVIKKSPSAFAFENYGRLRHPETWASMKLLCMDRDKLASSMKRWTKDSIHNALTEIDNKQLEKLACLLFKNIQGFMGDRKLDGPFLLASELISSCLQEKGLRDEIYCQIIKQIIGNQHQESIQRGFDLLLLCLDAFSPPAEFENFLELWLQQNCKQPERFIRTLHTTLYGGDRLSVLSEQEMRSLLSGNQLRDSSFLQDVAYVTPQAALPPRQQKLSLAQLSNGTLKDEWLDPLAVASPSASVASYPAASFKPPASFSSAAVIPPAPEDDDLPPPPAPEDEAPAPLPPRPALPPPPKKRCPWQAVADPSSGMTYYWNEDTNATQWEKPADFF